MHHSPVILLTDWIRNCKADDQLSDETDRANLSSRSISIYFYSILHQRGNFHKWKFQWKWKMRHSNEALTSRKICQRRRDNFYQSIKKRKILQIKLSSFPRDPRYILDRFRAKWNPDLDPPSSALSREANICEEDGDPSQSVDPVFQRLRKLLDERMLIVQLHD